MKLIICIQGFTGAGKDSIANIVSDKLNIPILVSHTTRPKRPGEIEGKTYHYVDDKFFDENEDNFIEKRIYNTEYGVWKYGLHQNELDKPCSLFIVDRQGYEELQKKLGEDKLVSIFIEVPEDTLRERQSKRGDCTKEFERRLLDDINRFKGYISDYVIYNDNLQDSVSKVKSIIIDEMSKREI